MQCTRCARVLPEGTRFCFSCGLPVTSTNENARGNPTSTNAGANTGLPLAHTPAKNIEQGASGTTGTGFTFQEFGAPVQTRNPPLLVPPGTMRGYAGPALYPAQPMGYTPGIPRNSAPPIATVPTPKRRGRSVGCIVLYAFLAIALLFTGLGVTLYEIGSHVLGSAAANYSATETAAMQLYQHITSQAPAIQDPLTSSSSNLWPSFEEATYGCTRANDGLHVHISDAGNFMDCLDTANFFANVALQVQMQVLTGDAGGLVFRSSVDTSGSSESMYVFQIAPNGSYALYLEKGTKTAQISRLASGITHAIDAQTDQTNTLTLIARGPTFDLYINQQFVVQMRDATLATGAIGMLADDHENAADVLYTNAKIWDLDNAHG